GIDAALRHLPDMGFVDMFRAAFASPDKHQAVPVDQCDADAGAIRQIIIGMRHSDRSAMNMKSEAARRCAPSLIWLSSPPPSMERGRCLCLRESFARRRSAPALRAAQTPCR